MRFMVMVKATPNSEAGAMPSEELLAAMGRFNEWVKRCPDPMPGEESVIEIRQVFEAEDFGAEFTPELREQEKRQRAQVAELAKPQRR
jgi:hypothetical protein